MFPQVQISNCARKQHVSDLCIAIVFTYEHFHTVFLCSISVFLNLKIDVKVELVPKSGFLRMLLKNVSEESYGPAGLL